MTPNSQNSKLPVVILAGGKGSRIIEYTKAIPKPLINVNRVPILIRIINHYISYGFEDFIIATGYLHNVIDKYFHKKFKKKEDEYIYNQNVKVKLVFTGLNTMTGGRVLRLKKYLKKKNTQFCLTYGDGLSDINLSKLL